MSTAPASEIDMKIDPARAKSLVGALQSVEARIANVASGRKVGWVESADFLFPSPPSILPLHNPHFSPPSSPIYLTLPLPPLTPPRLKSGKAAEW